MGLLRGNGGGVEAGEEFGGDNEDLQSVVGIAEAVKELDTAYHRAPCPTPTSPLRWRRAQVVIHVEQATLLIKRHQHHFLAPSSQPATTS